MTMGDQTEEFEFNEEGQLIRLNGGQTYLRYIEHQDGQETPIKFRLDGDAVQLDRHGARETRLVFQTDQETTTRYQTEYGPIHLVVHTKELVKEVDFANCHGMVKATYLLKNNGQVLGSYRIQLQFQA
ncbi:MAG TPA: DUF1934 domain-containing protein [Candidatus Limosilactobacillus intestinavium]|nr:DUF1934 domain-containing protein [Candidatus Limosilactobacillus intestinavium]